MVCLLHFEIASNHPAKMTGIPPSPAQFGILDSCFPPVWRQRVPSSSRHHSFPNNPRTHIGRFVNRMPVRVCRLDIAVYDPVFPKVDLVRFCLGLDPFKVTPVPVLGLGSGPELLVSLIFDAARVFCRNDHDGTLAGAFWFRFFSGVFRLKASGEESVRPQVLDFFFPSLGPLFWPLLGLCASFLPSMAGDFSCRIQNSRFRLVCELPFDRELLLVFSNGESPIFQPQWKGVFRRL